MQKKLLIAVGILLLLLVIGGGLFLMNKSTNKPAEQKQTGQANTEMETQKEPSTISGTIKDLLSGGKTQTCTITFPDGGGTGVIYTDGKKFSEDFKVAITGEKEVSGHMLSDGTNMYSWSDESNMGVKMNLAEAQKQITPAPNQQNQSLDLNKKIDFKCTSWAADSAKFSVPTNIKFTDLTTMMQQFKQPAATGQTPSKAGMAAACDQIEDATAKADCVKALSGK